MKSKIIELDVDFIGSEAGLTIQEEKALSVYFAKKKQAAVKRAKSKGVKRSKTTT